MPQVPKEFPVRPLRNGSAKHKAAEAAGTLYTCGACGRAWDDGIVTSWTPTPSARCPFEYFH